MREQIHLYVPAIAGALMTIMLWVSLGLRMRSVGKSLWRPAFLCLPALLIAIGYGLYWMAFFSSSDVAVKMHAARLTISHLAHVYLGDALIWIAIPWLLTGLGLLLPAFTSKGQ